METKECTILQIDEDGEETYVAEFSEDLGPALVCRLAQTLSEHFPERTYEVQYEETTLTIEVLKAGRVVR